MATQTATLEIYLDGYEYRRLSITDQDIFRAYFDNADHIRGNWVDNARLSDNAWRRFSQETLVDFLHEHAFRLSVNALTWFMESVTESIRDQAYSAGADSANLI